VDQGVEACREKCGLSFRSSPQRLKPHSFFDFYGMPEGMPFQKRQSQTELLSAAREVGLADKS
jgi:hypothetical protein